MRALRIIGVLVTVLTARAAVVSAQAPLAVIGAMSAAQREAPQAALVRCAWPGATVSTRLVFEGDTACGRYRVDAVHGATVTVLDRESGTAHVFELSQDAAATPARAAGHTPVALASSASPLAVSASPDLVRVRLPRAQLDASLADLPGLLNGAVVWPVTIDTAAGPRIDGFEMRSLPRRGLMADLGLRDGDVLLELNGARLTGLTAVDAAVKGLLTAGHATALVRRGDARMVFVVDVE